MFCVEIHLWIHYNLQLQRSDELIREGLSCFPIKLTIFPYFTVLFAILFYFCIQIWNFMGLELIPFKGLVSQTSIDGNFSISLHGDSFAFESLPCRSDKCLVLICENGKADVEVDLRRYTIEKNDIFVVFPGLILSGWRGSADLDMACFTFSGSLIDDILFRFPTAFVAYLKENVKYNLPEEEKDQLLSEYFHILNNRFVDAENVCRGEIILNLLHNFYLDLYNKILKNNDLKIHQRQRKKEIHDTFLQLLKVHVDKRSVAFYADKLCITPKYLSIITKECTGNSAKELIDNFAVTELKLRLKSDSTPLKEIAYQLNYPGEAFLCRFFKQHTGLTPFHYRNQSH